MNIQTKFYQKCALAVFALICFSSCEPELDFESFEATAKGSFARKLEVSGSYNTASLSTSSVDVRVEFYDQNQGQDIVSYDWTVSFKSNGGNNGEDVEAAFIKNLPSDLFSENADGLPEVSFSFELSEVLNALGIDGSSLIADDLFRFEATVVTEDGSEFNSSNTGPNLISQSPFGALFRLDVPVVCELAWDMFSGNYRLVHVKGFIRWGSTWGLDVIFSLSQTINPNQRVFSPFWAIPIPFNPLARGWRYDQVLEFKCDKVIVVESALGVGCGGLGIVIGQEGSTPGNFNILDDSSFTVNLTDDLYSSCAQAVTDISYTFIKL